MDVKFFWTVCFLKTETEQIFSFPQTLTHQLSMDKVNIHPCYVSFGNNQPAKMTGSI